MSYLIKPMRLLELLGFSAPAEEPVETIKLAGPFLQEDFLIRYRSKYIELLYKTITKCNLIISRDLLILSQDLEFSQRDNPRLEVGLNHHVHQLELNFKGPKDYEILAIDRFVILNPSDAKILKDYINHHLPTEDELKRNHLNA